MMNISKTKRYPIHGVNPDIPKQERGKWLNTWFFSEEEKRKSPKRLYTPDTFWTLKEVDEESMHHLYGRRFNNISLMVYPSYVTLGKFTLNCIIHSIDDGWYRAIFPCSEYDVQRELRLKIMKYISDRKVVNGEDFLTYCKSLGSQEVDYS